MWVEAWERTCRLKPCHGFTSMPECRCLNSKPTCRASMSRCSGSSDRIHQTRERCPRFQPYRNLLTCVTPDGTSTIGTLLELGRNGGRFACAESSRTTILWVFVGTSGVIG